MSEYFHCFTACLRPYEDTMTFRTRNRHEAGSKYGDGTWECLVLICKVLRVSSSRALANGSRLLFAAKRQLTRDAFLSLMLLDFRRRATVIIRSCARSL